VLFQTRSSIHHSSTGPDPMIRNETLFLTKYNLRNCCCANVKQDEVEKVAREVLVCTSLVCLVVLISDTELTALVKSNVLALIQKWNKVCSWITNLDIRYLVLCT